MIKSELIYFVWPYAAGSRDERVDVNAAQASALEQRRVFVPSVALSSSVKWFQSGIIAVQTSNQASLLAERSMYCRQFVS